MASLANQTISSTYDGLVKTSTDQPVPISGVQLLEDGVGNSLALSVGRANQGVTITGTLTATSISGVLADGVTATTQSSGDNSTKVATTAYVDAQVTASDLDFAGDSGTGAVDLDSQSLTIAGTANEIETSASGQTITIGLPSSVTVGTLTATTLAGTLSTAAQTNITSVGTLSSLAVSGNLTVDTNTLFVDAANNSVGIGTVTPLSLSGSNLSIVSSGNVRLQLDSTTDFRLVSNTSGNFAIQDATNSSDKLTINADGSVFFRNNSSETMRIDSSGSVLINNTSVYGDKLVVNSGNYDGTVGSAAIRVYTGGGTGDDTYHGAVAFAAGTGAAAISAVQTGTDSDRIGLSFWTHDTGTGTDPSVERMRIDSSGNVGIGESNPQSELHISSSFPTIRLQDNAYPATNHYSTIDGNGGSGYLTLSADDGNLATNSAMLFKVDGSERMRIDDDGNVGINCTPAYKLEINHTGTDVNALVINDKSTPASTTGLYMRTTTEGRISVGSNAAMTFYNGGSSGTERMRIDGSGNVGIGGTSSARLHIAKTDNTVYDPTADDGQRGVGATIELNNNSTTTNTFGQIMYDSDASGQAVARIVFLDDGASSSEIAFVTEHSEVKGERMRIASDGTINLALISQRVVNLSNVAMAVGSNSTGAQIRFQPQTDNAVDLGSSGVRWDDVYATNGTILTSDANEKQQIDSLDEAELRVAARIKGLVRKFKWNTAVDKKGENARVHIGVIAQDVKAAFEAEGLEADKYSLFTSNTWWEKEIIEIDSEGVETTKIEVLEEYEEGATERTRLGVRYTELLAFVIAAL